MSRPWGFWTRGELDVLRRYLDAFTTASKKRSTRIYLDLFAGDPNNRDRLTGDPIEGSARIALSIDDPPFTHIRLFEKDLKAKKLESALRSDFPDRNLKVYGGDCNEQLPEALKELEVVNWAPTFAFVDPNGKETKWKTLEALADFRPARLTKAELFLLFAQPMFTRLLRVDGGKVRSQDIEDINDLFGTEDWRKIYEARLAELIESKQASYEYLNLMRWRLENVLGYKWTHPLEIRNETNHVIYYMIFATTHEAGNKIMSNVYARAAEEFPAMREYALRRRSQLKEEQSGVMSLFSDDESLWAPAKLGKRSYRHEPPQKPWFMNAEVSQ